MRQAIVTKYLGPTNTKGARIKATASAGSITIPWDYELDTRENHRRAAEALAAKFKWGGRWVGGVLPQTAPGFSVFVCTKGGTEFIRKGQ